MKAKIKKQQGEYEYMYINESENKETTRNNKQQQGGH
jgi:hypothetical protein